MPDAPTFWDHLEVLRHTLWRVSGAALLAILAAFFFRDAVFGLLLYPTHPDFPSYRLLTSLLSHVSHAPAEAFLSPTLVNTELSGQLWIHLQVSVYVGLFAVLPYLLFEAFRYLSPALYAHERRAIRWSLLGGYALFFGGICFAYFVLFPFTFRFLIDYSVSAEVHNFITLSSYIDTFLFLSLAFGLTAELPLAGLLLARLGVLSAALLTRFRRHAVVVLLVLAAVITPTTDPFTLMVVFLPMYLLFEFTVLLMRHFS